MPYIKQSGRDILDPFIDKLAEAIVEQDRTGGDGSAWAGSLNYSCTRLIMRIIKLKFVEVRYAVIAMVTGVLANINSEFYRCVATPYERLQIKNNGNVAEYREFNKLMEIEMEK